MTLRFTTRLFLCALLPALLFMTALSASLWGSMRTQVEFDRYIGTEQQVASGLNEMYAQGLQMGQAMRNVVLNPENQKAFENFALAEAAFAKAFEATAATAKGTAMEKEIQRLAPLREAQASKQARVISLVKTDVPGAIKALNAEETPAWRALRALLIEQIAASRELASTVHAQTKQRASNMTWVAVALALAAIGTAVVMTVLLMKTVNRELGGDPVDACNALRRIADGDLSVDADAQGAAQGLMGQLGRTQERLRELVTQVRRSTDSIHVASSEIASGNHDLSGRTEQAAANLQQTASSMEELTGAVRQSADAARQANQLAASAAEVAVRGGKVVTQVVGTMDAIHASSRKIADITGVIDGIAFQTNILALNAAVEAARAGEQGRGFAVVAGEVRLLAQRSAEAAREIKALIGSSVDKVEAGSRLVADAGTTMTDIVASVQRVTDIIGEITASAAEQASGIGQVHGSVTELDHMTQQNAALVEQSAAAASSLNEQAQRLSQLVATFKLNPA